MSKVKKFFYNLSLMLIFSFSFIAIWVGIICATFYAAGIKDDYMFNAGVTAVVVFSIVSGLVGAVDLTVKDCNKKKVTE